MKSYSRSYALEASFAERKDSPTTRYDCSSELSNSLNMLDIWNLKILLTEQEQGNLNAELLAERRIVSLRDTQHDDPYRARDNIKLRIKIYNRVWRAHMYIYRAAEARERETCVMHESSSPRWTQNIVPREIRSVQLCVQRNSLTRYVNEALTCNL